MNYCYIRNNIVERVVPEFDPTFPEVPIEERYSEDFVAHLVADDTETVRYGYLYDADTNTFSAPRLTGYIAARTMGLSGSNGSSVNVEDLTIAIAELAEKQETDKLEMELVNRTNVEEISLAIAELAEKQEADKLEMELAIAELAESTM